jgi:hypothetical protein
VSGGSADSGRMRHHIFLAALGLAALHADAGHAQAPCRRCLDGFRYLPSSIVGDAFATTHFENATGGGMALNLNVPVRNAEGATIDSLSGNIGFLLVDFGYQKRLARWLALNGTIIAAGRVGTSIEAVAASGASAAFGWALGATAPLLDRQKFLVSAVGEYRHNTEYDINPYEFAQQIVDSGYTQGAKDTLLTSGGVNRWALGLRGAYTIAPWVGLNGEIETGAVDQSSDSKSVTTFGAQVAFDFGKLSQIPVGVTLGYHGQTGSGRTGSLSGGYRSGEFGIYYVGRTDFVIGGSFFLSRVAAQNNDVPDLDALQFRVVTRIEF